MVEDTPLPVARLASNHDKPYAYQPQTPQIYFIHPDTVSCGATRAEP